MNDFLRNTIEVPVELLVRIDSTMSLVAHRGLDVGDKKELIELSRAVRALYDRPDFKMRKVKIWFFGCQDQPGHHLFDQAGNLLGYTITGCPWDLLDGPLMPHIDRHGNAAIHHKDGWTAIDISDRSIDSRPGSHALFVFDSNLKFAEGMRAIQTFFPKIYNRIGKVTLVDNL